MFEKGQGVVQDYKEAVKWYRLSAEQGLADAQYNLGGLYEKGLGVVQSRVIAYALYNLSVAADPSSDNKATAAGEALVPSMSASEIEAAQTLMPELGQPKNFIKALDQYTQKITIKK